jgi:serine/threonine-protein kinase
MTLLSDPYSTLTVDPREESSSERFRILRPHARGGLGEVFVAQDRELPREVALKQIQSHHAHDEMSRERFVREAEITGGLEHPGIVPVYGLGTYPDGRPYYAMRFIRGETLKEAIQRFHEADEASRDLGVRSVELRRLLGHLLEACHAIEYAHSRGVVHRDLKPSNIMVGKYGETLVVDWGLAKAAGKDDLAARGGLSCEPVLQPRSGSTSEPTAMGKALGTPAYMSPEQAAGRIDLVGVRSDVYSLGATLYEILTGRAPVQGDSVDELLRRAERGDFPAPRKIKPNVRGSLESICLKALAHEPADRYPTAAALAADLERWLADEPIAAHRDRLSERVDRWLRRHRAWAQAAAIGIVVVAAVSWVALAAVKRAHTIVVLEHAEEVKAKQEAEKHRTLAKDAVDRYEDAVDRLKQLATRPELAALRDSAAFRELLDSYEDSKATVLDEEGSK